MEIVDAKLKEMILDHKSRAGELEYVLSKSLPKLKEDLGDLWINAEDVLKVALRYYRHVGAIWMLEGLNGKESDWDSCGSNDQPGEAN